MSVKGAMITLLDGPFTNTQTLTIINNSTQAGQPIQARLSLGLEVWVNNVKILDESVAEILNPGQQYTWQPSFVLPTGSAGLPAYLVAKAYDPANNLLPGIDTEQATVVAGPTPPQSVIDEYNSLKAQIAAMQAILNAVAVFNDQYTGGGPYARMRQYLQPWMTQNINVYGNQLSLAWLTANYPSLFPAAWNTYAMFYDQGNLAVNDYQLVLAQDRLMYQLGALEIQYPTLAPPRTGGS